MEDGLAWVDDLIADARTDARARPHQLMLSGDQIYADDVALPMLPQLRDRGIELLGPHEHLPMRWRETSAAPGCRAAGSRVVRPPPRDSGISSRPVCDTD